MGSVNRAEKDEALFVAEQFADYCHKKEKEERQRRLAYVENKREMQTSRRLVAGLSLVFSIMIFMCAAIVSLNIQATQRKEEIAKLEARVTKAQKETKEARKRLTDEIDYKWVQEEAEKLGMSRVTPDRIYYYTVEEDDFMVQYKDVPES